MVVKKINVHKITNVRYRYPFFYIVLRLNDFDEVSSITRAIGRSTGMP
jgi:hypothetical protein